MTRSSILIIDLTLVFCSAAFAVLLRDKSVVAIETIELTVTFSAVAAAVGLVVLPAFGNHCPLRRYSIRADFKPISVAAIFIASGAVVLCYAFHCINDIPCAAAALQSMLIFASLVGVRLLLCAWGVMSEGIVANTNAVAGGGGDGALSDLYMRAAAQSGRGHVRAAGLLSECDAEVGRTRRGYRVSGTAKLVVRVVRDLKVRGVYVNRIVVAASAKEISAVASTAFRGLAEAIRIRMHFLSYHLGMAPQASATSCSTPDDNRSFAEDLVAPLQRNYWATKRALDIVGATVLLIVLSPLLIVVSIAIAIDLGWPIAFWQRRPGRHGQPFTIYKFRTMSAAYDEHGVPVAVEARLSSLGRLLRATHVDELPQLFNILAGEMSFVGPRPLLPADQPDECATRFLVPPGLTGWAQVMGGRRISAADKAALDSWYVQRASLTLDFDILLRTILLMLFGERVDGVAIRRARDELGQVRISKAAGVSSERAGIAGVADGE